MDAWLAAALADPRGSAYGDARSALFTAVREERNGPVARLLFGYFEHPDAEARCRTLQLLTDMSWGAQPWHAAAERARSCLADPDGTVRRSAAWLLATADPEHAFDMVREPGSPLDPVARLALVEAMFSSHGDLTGDAATTLAESLRTDPDDAVRLRAALAAVRVAPEEQWPMWEDLALSCLPSAGERLGGPGSKLAVRPGWWWSLALVRQDREEAAYNWASQLLVHPSPVARLAGVDIARGALRRWRGAPDRLSLPLSAALGDADAEVRGEAVSSVCASLDASRLCADVLAAVLEDPGIRTEAAMGLGRVGDQRAATVLSGLVRTGFISRGFVEAVEGVIPPSTDPALWVDAVREALRAADQHCPEDRWHTGCLLAGALAAAVSLGPAAAPLVPDLVALVDTSAPSPQTCRVWVRRRALDVLAALGPAASSAGPALLRCLEREDLADTCAAVLLSVTGERTHAESRLDQLPDTVRAMRRVLPLMECLHAHGGLTPRHAERLSRMAEDPRRLHPRAMRLLWNVQGPSVAPLLLEVVPDYVTDDVFGLDACDLLADMSPFAQQAVPALEALAYRRTRIGVNTGDEDEELRRDERLARAARSALERLSPAQSAGQC
ncbi:HEAT repeat domain-containing protein [Streptacidiphilus melanogenes]|uniref:HEAT repeat domain-containing protein n=1 Tax=Streptacidiphilus melanogenes TaxID=411235 RepID=UPI000A3F73F5|nr:HEAT repeat domain-containing protein [Streptacidiphilus melanogenes]